MCKIEDIQVMDAAALLKAEYVDAGYWIVRGKMVNADGLRLLAIQELDLQTEVV